MKQIQLIIASLLILSFTFQSDCGDGTVYSSKKQTENDKRFAAYPKIEDVPAFKDGEKKLDKLIRSEIKLSDVAKTQIFNLNYQFTVSCDGKIKDVKQIGNPKMDDWTNISEVIQLTEGNWKPALKDGKPVDCIYFRTLLFNGSN